MAGRGKGMTLPAWMTGAGGEQEPQQPAAPQPVAQAYAYVQDRDARRSRSRDSGRHSARARSRSRSREASPRSRGRDRSSDRDRGRDRDRYSERGRDRDRPSHGGRRGAERSVSPEEAPKKWVSRIKNRKSNFDAMPPDGVVLPPIGGLGTSLNPALPVGVDGSLHSGMTNDVANMQQTKHARRIYIGGIGNDAVDKDIEDFMRDVIRRAMGSNAPAGDPVLSSYVNRDKCFCFLELNSIELTTACCSLDGISYRGNTLKIRRPNDFRPEAMPTNLPPTPVFDLAALGIVGTTVAEGPGKVFVGGLPYHLTEDEIKELLSAFGPLRSFHLVKDTGALNSKGYAFCEYVDFQNTLLACQGLNGLQVGDKTLTVRVAQTQTQQSQPPSAPPGQPDFNPYLQQRPPPPPPPVANLNPLATNTPSKVIILKNMVISEELQDDEEFADICDDVRDECAQHGPVMSVLIPRVKENYPPQCEGSVFVEFQHPETAQKAALALSGRKFAERTVDVDYFDEIKFSNRILV